MTIALLYGGKSGEHEISLRSAASVGRALEKAGFSLILIGIARDGSWYAQGREVFTAMQSGVDALPLVTLEEARVTVVPSRGIVAGGCRINADRLPVCTVPLEKTVRCKASLNVQACPTQALA